MLGRKLEMLYYPLRRPMRFSWEIIVFCFVLFNLCMCILYSEYIFYITRCCCVTLLCIAWLVYSFHPHKSSSLRDPTSQMTGNKEIPKQGITNCQTPDFSIKIQHPFRVKTARAQRCSGFLVAHPIYRVS